jgi:GH25 family lysozyme M1 (1,4-beta-N-acetylmuramidase)
MQKLLDVWEGSLDIEEETICAGGVVGLFIRLNHISGGNHKDANFDSQWCQSRNFLRAPYYVYNPWNDGKTNFNWLMANLPQNDVTLVSSDVEVVYNNYSSEVYADQVEIFTDLLKSQLHTIIYTGQWFLSYLSHWPTDVEYWWARYPNRFYPAQKEVWSWAKLTLETENYGWHPDPLKKSPGTVAVWQCSGNRLILPGCANRPVDVNLANKTLPELEAWWPAKMPSPALTMAQKVDVLWREAGIAGWNLS